MLSEIFFTFFQFLFLVSVLAKEKGPEAINGEAPFLLLYVSLSPKYMYIEKG